MKVLVLHSELGVLRGGGENFTRNLFTALARRGHHVAAAFVADPKGRYPLPLPSSIEPIPIRGWWSRKLGQAAFLFISGQIPSESRLRVQWDRVQEAVGWRTVRWHDQRFQRRVVSEFAGRWGDFDTVYVHGNVMLASEVAQYCPTVLRLPGPVSADLEPALRKVHAVCANGDALRKTRSFLHDNVIELPVGLDEKLFKPGLTSIRSALGWTNQDRVVGYVGRLNYLKGVDLLAVAFREISSSIANARLLIIGQGESGRGIRSILAKGLARKLVHIEQDVDHEQLPQWYRAMNFLVLPSRYENFSNAALEAIGCGVPVLSSDVGGNGLLAEGAGYLFEANSVSSLCACLRIAFEKAAAMKSEAEIRSRYVRERYNWAASAEHLESVIVSRLGVNR